MGKERSSRHSDRDRGRDDSKKKRRRSRSRDDSYSPKRKHSKGTEGSSKKGDDKEKRVRRSNTSMIEAEADVKKRKERVEKWRALMKKKEEEEMKNSKEENGNIGDQDTSNLNNSISAAIPTEEKHSTWTLEDENDDDDEEVINNVSEEQNEEKVNQSNDSVQEEEEIDPLDLFMSELEQTNDKKPKVDTVTIKSTSKLKVITAPIAKTIDEHIDAKKGDIIENDDTNYEAKDDFDLEEAKEQFITKSRTLLQVDHEKVYYAPFNKMFYREVPELTKMTEEEVKEYRKELEGIKIRGTGTLCKPLKSWAQCGFEWKLLSFLKKLGYEKPTPIQAQAIPCILSGRDVIGIAKTGSGKTLAFLLPMFRHILDQPELDEGDGPIGLILTPTRELAMQIWKETQKFSKLLKLKSVCVYGGVGISEQIADLKRQPEIVICTPGRMIEMLHSNNGKVTNLRRITYVVLDEADRMFDMGFEPQVMKIIQNIRPDKQMLLFSATFPKQMEALARKVLDKPVEIQVGGKSIVCKDVCQSVIIIEESHKFLKLLELLGIYYETGNVIIFTEKQEKADEIVNMLIKAGYMAAPLHGSIDQFDRDSTIVDFKQGVVKIIVATSVAARGLDVKKLKLVVNYDCPNHYEDYVHRVGRTGRAGNKGFAYTFILPEGQEKMAGEICRAFESAELKPPQELKDMFKKWKEDMKKEGKVVKIGTGGFGGSGYKYDAIEDEAAVNKRKMEKLLLGMENQIMDDDDEIEEHLTSMMKSNKRYLEKGAINSKVTTPVVGNVEAATAASDSAMEKVKAVAARIAAERAMAAETKPAPIQSGSVITAPNIITGSTIHINVSAAEKAKQIAEALNEKLNYIPTESSSLFDAPENIHYFEEELEINDFPQQVRYKVCSRETISRIQEIADVGISVKGTYYPNNKEPKSGDRKLYIFIEARDEFSLKRAKEEIIYTMKEAFKQITGANKGPQGRYKIV